MKVRIEIELDGSGRDVAALNAITRAIANLPPADLEIYPGGDKGDPTVIAEPTKVEVWAAPAKMAEAKAAVNTTPTAEVVAKPVEAPAPAAEAKPMSEEDAVLELRAMVAKLVVDPNKSYSQSDLRQMALDVVGKADLKQFTVADYQKAVAHFKTL